jgi:hypothetical protein
MLGITTKYISASNTKGSRIKATVWNWAKGKRESVTISYPHQFSGELCHFEAVKALAKKLDLQVSLDNMRFGGLENGYCFCFESSIVREGKNDL